MEKHKELKKVLQDIETHMKDPEYVKAVSEFIKLTS